MNYSVAIRTLGNSGDALRRELESLHHQTVRPQKIIIYIAQGYSLPDFRVGIEQYVPVKKGMVAQRALPYSEIDSEYILLLDDDVLFEHDSLKRLLDIITHNNADCVACDTFQNHKMSISGKVKAAIGNWVVPHYSQRWAFKIHSSGTFSYIAHPSKSYYPSMSAAGPAALWRRTSLLRMDFQDELWLDSLGFSYGDDELEFYKLYINGGKLLVSFDCGVTHIDAKSSSSKHHSDAEKLRRIGKAQKILWHRMIYTTAATNYQRVRRCMAYKFKEQWTVGMLGILSIKRKYKLARKEYIMGLREANDFIGSNTYLNLPAYKMDADKL